MLSTTSLLVYTPPIRFKIITLHITLHDVFNAPPPCLIPTNRCKIIPLHLRLHLTLRLRIGLMMLHFLIQTQVPNQVS